MFPHLSLKCASACLFYRFVAWQCFWGITFMYVCALALYMRAQTTYALIAGSGGWNLVNGEFDAHRGLEFLLMAGATVHNTDGVY